MLDLLHHVLPPVASNLDRVTSSGCNQARQAMIDLHQKDKDIEYNDSLMVGGKMCCFFYWYEMYVQYLWEGVFVYTCMCMRMRACVFCLYEVLMIITKIHVEIPVIVEYLFAVTLVFLQVALQLNILAIAFLRSV